MMKGSKAEEVLSDKLKPDHTLGASIAISIMSGGWALGGFIDLEEGRDEYGSGRLAEKAITLQTAGPWKVNGSCLCPGPCDQQPRLDNGGALQAPRMATSWAVTRAQGGLTRLGAG